MSQSRFAEALNGQIAYEFGASQQYIAIAVHYDAETPRRRIRRPRMPPAARSSPATAVILVALLLACGCFGGGASTAAGPTRPQFIARAVAICARYQHRIDALPKAGDLSGLAAAGRRAIALERAELRDLRALTPPAAD